ncbi:copper-translocating P-type ATPase [Devosia pacifica]|uniref:P-type Cu(+) transporter n=1 Tax=Devosia pacifica TaxID=1335967 RepID=A0A918VU92_9HYPH|nr:heavy metal translocating P-type ATPase [Devosia pacifica]GHA29736.1 copper-translocating P-type ATPase [Devosia pacifica]
MTQIAATTNTIVLSVSGMSCASCVGRVERALNAVPGVTEANVNLATQRATVHASSGAADDEALVAAVGKAGYEAEVQRDDHSSAETTHGHHDEDAAELKRDVIIATALTLPLFILEMGSHLIPGMHHALIGMVPQQSLHILYFILASIVLFWPGLRFFRIGVPALFRGAPEMNTLVALGAGAAWAFSSVVTFAPQLVPEASRFVYFEAAAVIVTLVLVGRWLEARAKGRANTAIEKLADRQAKSARVLRNGQTEEIAIADIRIGDLIIVRPGERIAVDGTVREGTAHVDESMISGEPLPVSRSAGEPVIGGTIATDGTLTIAAEKVGRNTMLSQIIRMVEDAQGAKLPIQSLVDKITFYFVPAVMALAAATFLVWWLLLPESTVADALVHAVAVLIIACPCAMGLATPMSIMVGTGRAAELGVLFRRGDALERLRSTDLVVFDKTGTLTLGRPVLDQIIVVDPVGEDEILAVVAAAESRSEHPLAAAIVTGAEKRGLNMPALEQFTAVAGLGVNATINGRSVVVGSPRFLQQSGITLDALTEKAEAARQPGASIVYAAIEGRPVAALLVADTIKPESRTAIEALRQRGIEVAMITGDSAQTAKAIAGELGIETVEAEVMPGDKAAAIKRLRDRHRTISFVGDGINDAPALAEADIGIAMGTGTDVAIDSADLVLVGGDPRLVGTAIDLSQKTLRNIGQNLVWAFGYNVLLIPVAAGVFYPFTGLTLSPMLGALAMAFSSVFVVGNALRLRGHNGKVTP